MWLSTDSSNAERSAIAAYFSGAQTTGNANLMVEASADLENLLAIEVSENPALAGLSEHIRFYSDPNSLRIELTDATTGSLFMSGSEKFSETGLKLAKNIGLILKPLSLGIRIEGHTDAFKTAPGTPTNWEISTARANSALRELESAGIAPQRFKSIAGLAATKPLLPNQPHAAVNRRISIVLELSK